MKFLPSMALAALAITAATPALASLDLATKKACMACHSVDNKVVGPAYKEVAKRYAADKTAEAKLVQTVLKGSDPKKPNWGGMAMPANKDRVSEAEAKQLVKWILSLK
ncbi:MAG TPA: c-type cytochrome [Aquabacterium sp.]|uniref:c-type cytochrome n=1 Tax=Aquabacterium sp. TaxID=1872578 RepID=UPI002E2FF1FC|nr:c-type cytochrome [Aquabacterium sp.]HEX5374392.1 c-type cytochrome [Aquabacterium sp.]